MSARKLVFWLHLITGVIAGLVIFIMSVTGVLLMYERQITAWADENTVTLPPDQPARMPMETMLRRLREVETNAPTAITISSDPTAATAFSFGREKTLYANPYTGDVLGEGCKTAHAFFQTMIEWHRWLGMAGDNRAIGKAITGACNLGFLFLVMSGFYLWWPRNWNWRSVRSVTLFGRGLKGKARDWNWHNVIGFWTALPLFVLVFTATFFSYPWATALLYKAAGEEPPPPRASRERSPGKQGHPEKQHENDTLAGMEVMWAKAEQQVAGWKTVSLRVPASPAAPLVFNIDRGNGARPDLRGTLTLNAQTGEIESWETISSQSTARQIRSWIRWIHTGEAGGFIGQTIAGVASAGGAVLVWTGLALAWRRFRGRKQAQAC